MKQPRLTELSAGTRERLRALVSLLHAWNGRINLVARTDIDEIWRRHVLDSVQVAKLVGPGVRSFMDLGSGAGFPGLVVAIVTGVHGHLTEADRRKAAFLREAARVTEAPVSVHAVRIETMSGPIVPLVMARALAPLPGLLALAYPRLTECGECLFLKGRDAERELTQARAEWQMNAERIPSETDRGGCVLRIRDLTPIRDA